LWEEAREGNRGLVEKENSKVTNVELIRRKP